MFDVTLAFMNSLVSLIIPLICLYVLFDFIGSLLFGKK